MDDIANLALAPRSCNADGRIPTGRYPLFSQGFLTTIAAGATAPAAPIVFTAERDTLFTDLAATVLDDVTGLEVDASIDVNYCNTRYIESCYKEEWKFCCQRRPLFLVGVRENKRLQVDVATINAAVNAVSVGVELSGFQGNGCCA